MFLFLVYSYIVSLSKRHASEVEQPFLKPNCLGLKFIFSSKIDKICNSIIFKKQEVVVVVVVVVVVIVVVAVVVVVVVVVVAAASLPLSSSSSAPLSL